MAGVEPEVDSLALEFRGQAVAQILIEAAQNLLAAIELRHLAAQAVEDAGELHRDVAAAEHGDAPGQFFELEGLVRGDAVFARETFGTHRMRAIGYEDLLRRDASTRDLRRMGIEQPRPAFDQGHFRDGEQLAIDGF